MHENILIYGANGYTADLVTDLAVKEGGRPILAGRSAEKIAPIAARRNLKHRAFALDDPAAVAKGLEGVTVVLHCAGPFSRTAKPMAEGCLRAKAHYLDITGEIEVFELMASMSKRAAEAGVMLMPGTGFDVVPSDCLAAHLKRRLPDATELTLAFQAIGRPSRGTATTMIENIHRGGMIRRGGALTPVPAAWQMKQVDFGQGPVTTMSIPWGDVSTAFHSTGIPNIQVFMSAPAQLQAMAKLSRYLGGIIGSGPVQWLLKKQIQAGPAGPNEEERRTGRSLLWGEVKNAAGRSAHTRLTTPEGYALTSRTAWAIAKRAATGAAQPGFRTPSMVFGADFILEFDGVKREDVD
jgi:short subunit dehydrogenase-like uncharacterized protein